MHADARAHINHMLRVLAVIVLAFLAVPACAGPNGVVRVIDGDTWDVGGVRVRLYGIDAPEQDQACQRRNGETWACGAWVTQKVRATYAGKTARCTELAQDRYGRVVARCRIGGLDAGKSIVSEGLAFAYRRYAMDYDLDEKSAAVNDRGLHASRVQDPAAFRANRSNAPQPSRHGCDIKGNVSSAGAQIYHMPGQQHYAKTRISASKGERWFCSEAEALQAGWRRARR